MCKHADPGPRGEEHHDVPHRGVQRPRVRLLLAQPLLQERSLPGTYYSRLHYTYTTAIDCQISMANNSLSKANRLVSTLSILIAVYHSIDVNQTIDCIDRVAVF